MVTADPKNGNRISSTVPADRNDERVRLTITTTAGKELISAETEVK
jgi:hypothetical protein